MYAKWIERNRAAAVERIAAIIPVSREMLEDSKPRPWTAADQEAWVAERDRERQAQADWVQSLVGRTVASVDAAPRSYGMGSFDIPVVIRFTDGTAVRFDPDGYDVEGIYLTEEPPQ